MKAGPITVSKPRFCGNRAPDVLRLGADAHAAAALDALAVVAHQGGRRGVDPLAGLLAGVGDLADAQLGGQGLQLAVLVAVAGLALAVVLGEQQFDDGPAGLADAAGVGEDLHALGGRHRAGGDEVPRPFDLDHADAAGADRLQALDVAERGDADARLLRGRQDRGAFGHFDGDVVDRERYHGRFRVSGHVVTFITAVPVRWIRWHRALLAVPRSSPLAGAAFAVVAAEAAAGLADGHRLAPGLLHFVEIVPPPLDGDQVRASRAAASDGSASGSKAVSTSWSSRQKAWFCAGQVEVDAHGRPLAGRHRLDHRGRAA